MATCFRQSYSIEQLPLRNYAIKEKTIQIFQIYQGNGSTHDKKVSFGSDEVIHSF